MDGTPERDDLVATWLKKWRDTYRTEKETYVAIDDMLEAYRLHADTGTPLDEEVQER